MGQSAQKIVEPSAPVGTGRYRSGQRLYRNWSPQRSALFLQYAGHPEKYFQQLQSVDGDASKR